MMMLQVSGSDADSVFRVAAAPGYMFCIVVKHECTFFPDPPPWAQPEHCYLLNMCLHVVTHHYISFRCGRSTAENNTENVTVTPSLHRMRLRSDFAAFWQHSVLNVCLFTLDAVAARLWYVTAMAIRRAMEQIRRTSIFAPHAGCNVSLRTGSQA